MNYYLIQQNDPFTILQQGEFPNFSSARVFLLKGVKEDDSVEVVDETLLFQMRSHNTMSSVDETKGGS